MHFLFSSSARRSCFFTDARPEITPALQSLSLYDISDSSLNERNGDNAEKKVQSALE
jgi:hypothetical protein